MSLFPSFSETASPTAALEIAATHVAGAVVERRGGQMAIASHAVEQVPEGALVASLTTANVVDRPAVSGAVARVLERLGRPRRIALVIPDLAAKVALIKFEQVPTRAQDLDQLVRWQVRKTAPFPIEEAQVAYVAGQKAADGHEFIVSLARRDVIEEYERMAAAEGAHAGIVDLATFNVVNAAIAGGTVPAVGDWLLVNAAADYATLAVLRGANIILFRTRPSESDGALADLVHQTAMYYEDRLNGAGFAQVLLSGTGRTDVRQAAETEALRRGLEERLATTVTALDFGTAATITDRISADRALVDRLAPLVGVLVRGSEQAA